MIPELDVRTLVIAHVAVNIGQAMVMVYLWSVQRNYPPAKDWAIGLLMFALGLFLFSLRNVVPVFLSEIVSNMFLLIGLLIFNFGIVKAAGKTPPLYLGLAFCAIAIGILTWLITETTNVPARVLTHNFVFLTLDLYVAYACFSAKTVKGNYTFRILGVLFTVLFLACTLRVLGGVFDISSLLSPTLPRLLWIATSLVLFPMITLLLTLHTSQRLQEEIHAQARHDMLTGALNRRGFAEFSEKEWARGLRHGTVFSVLMVDIDFFKRFNDQYGHQTGDAALIAVSNAALDVLRSDDIWCRYGGEEFVALLPNTSIQQAMAVAERLRLSVENTNIASPRGLLKVSVSIGVAEHAANLQSFSAVLEKSDIALYRAKSAGRNIVFGSDFSEAI